MAYNVLNYGDGCQGPNGLLHGYLKTIIQYANPDVASLEKMSSIKISVTDVHGVAPYGFADSILDNAFNAAYPNRYAYCPWTNITQADNISILFYDKQKLTFVSATPLVTYITDFTMYKLYYNDPKLSTTHDTTWVYFVLNHDQSGSSSSTRDSQLTKETQAIASRVVHLPNMITMGDFNLRNSSETCYQVITNPTDTNFRFFDPPFTIDHHLTYPANWDAAPADYAAYLTTSTRYSGSIPNSCGTNGGGKSWYDHMFLSPWIVNNINYVQYIPNSYQTLGNDGNRTGRSINDSSLIKNTSAPDDVINALFQFSNKYPIMASLAVTSNTTGTSPADPDITTAVGQLRSANDVGVLVNPAGNKITFYLPANEAGRAAILECYDAVGRLVMKNNIISGTINELPCYLNKGVYYLRVYNPDKLLLNKVFTKE